MSTLTRYRLEGGPHIAEDITAEPLKDEKGNVIYKPNKQPKYPVKKFVRGDIVVSAENLMQKHVNKFVYAGPYGGQTPTAAQPPAQAQSTPAASAPPPPRFRREDLNAMKVADLRTLAAEEGIDLGTAEKKEDVIERFLSAK